MNRRAWLARVLSPVAAYVMTGCSTLKPEGSQKQPELHIWNGRLGLILTSEPPQSFSATFELRGTADEGALTLVNPLGSVLAAMQWGPGEATLHTGQDTRRFESIEMLTRHVTGTALPIRALFDWLGGVNTTAGGWRADLSRLEQGRLIATRTEPAPAAELKLILDR